MGQTTSVSEVSHAFIWKWSDEYTESERRQEVLRDLRDLFDSELLVKLTCGTNCIQELKLEGAGNDPKASLSAGFDCGMIAIAKDDDSFRRWWAHDKHMAFMKKHSNFAATKVNLEWRAQYFHICLYRATGLLSGTANYCHKFSYRPP